MLKSNLLILTGLLLIGSTGPAFSMSFEEALSETYKTSPVLLAERANARAQDELLPQAQAGWRPQISLEGEIDSAYQNVRVQNNSLLKGKETPKGISAQVIQPLFSGFKTVSGIKQAKGAIRLAHTSLLNVEQSVLSQAAISYMDVVEAEAVLDLQIKNEKVLRRHLKSTKDKFKYGTLTKTDLAQSEARLERATASRIEAEGDLQVKRATYQRVVGKLPVKLQEKTKLDAFLPTSKAEALSLAFQYNPSYLMAKEQEKVALYQVEMMKGDLMPSVNMIASVGRKWDTTQGYDDMDYWQVGANLSVPLYQGGGEYAKIREAKQKANQARILIEKARKAVKEGVTQSWEMLKSTQAAEKAIESQIKASKSALEGVRREADVGQRTVLDVLDAEQEYLDTRVSLVKAKRNETVAKVSLLEAVGRLSAKTLKLKVTAYDPKIYSNKAKGKWIGTGI